MKITKQYLQQVIKEELQKISEEHPFVEQGLMTKEIESAVAISNHKTSHEVTPFRKGSLFDKYKK